MATSRLSIFLILLPILLINRPVSCDDDEEDTLFRDINAYRASINLSALTKNENAECLAEEIADEYKNKPCTNTVDPLPKMEPNQLAKCRLNISNTNDGVILPVCVPNPVTTPVVANFTKSMYSTYLNDTKYSGIGIGSDDDWIVVVLTTNTTQGSFVNQNSAGLVYSFKPIGYVIAMLLACFFLF